MKYRSGYKYQLWEDESIQTDILNYDVHSRFIDLAPDGKLIARSGYAWDGASGPTFDSKYCMRGPLFHDVLYQLMRENKIDLKWRKYADSLMKRIINEDIEKMVSNMNVAMRVTLRLWAQARADLWYHAVRIAAGAAALAKNDRPILEAP